MKKLASTFVLLLSLSGYFELVAVDQKVASPPPPQQPNAVVKVESTVAEKKTEPKSESSDARVSLNLEQIDAAKKQDQMEEEKALLSQKKGDSGQFAPIDTTPLFIVEEPEDNKFLEKDFKTLTEIVSQNKSNILIEKSKRIESIRSIASENLALQTALHIWFVNDLSGWFKLNSMTCFLDNKLIYDSSNLQPDLQKLLLFEGPVNYGSHSLTIQMTLKGNGYGIFSYLNDRQVKVEGLRNFEIGNNKEGTSGEGLTLVDTLYVLSEDLGGFFTRFEERPVIKFEFEKEALTAAK